MPIPDFQTLMLPLLRYCADGAEHTKRDATPALAHEFQLSEAELAELLPTGRQGRFDNRVGWAKSYLKQAGLLEAPKRGVFRISERGRDALAGKPARIDMKFLEQYPEYQAFRRAGKVRADALSEASAQSSDATPEELLDAGYRQIRTELAGDLLQQVKSASPGFFERLVVELLLRMGYGGTEEDAGRVVGKSGDGGIDGIIKEDRLGLDVIYIQAKRWENDVGRREIQQFVGALAGHKASKGVFITTSNFNRNASAYAAQVSSKVVLIDGPMLVDLMIDFNLGVSLKQTYEIKRIDSDYFAED
jgi:restriction system protein